MLNKALIIIFLAFLSETALASSQPPFVKGRGYIISIDKGGSNPAIIIECLKECFPKVKEENAGKIVVELPQIERLSRLSPYRINEFQRGPIREVKLLSLHNNLAVAVSFSPNYLWNYKVKRRGKKTSLYFSLRKKVESEVFKGEKKNRDRASALGAAKSGANMLVKGVPALKGEGKAVPVLAAIKFALNPPSLVFTFTAQTNYQLLTSSDKEIKLTINKAIVANEGLFLPFFAPKDFPYVSYVKVEKNNGGGITAAIKLDKPAAAYPVLDGSDLVITFR